MNEIQFRCLEKGCPGFHRSPAEKCHRIETVKPAFEKREFYHCEYKHCPGLHSSFGDTCPGHILERR